MATFLELRIPEPITGAAQIVIEGELPTYGSGDSIVPAWDAVDTGSYWGIAGGATVARFLVLIADPGLPFGTVDSMTSLMSEIVNVDPTFPSLRNCFRLKQTIPAAATGSGDQSLYLKYAPPVTPESVPNGLAIYNVTAEALRPTISAGKYRTASRFY